MLHPCQRVLSEVVLIKSLLVWQKYCEWQKLELMSVQKERSSRRSLMMRAKPSQAKLVSKQHHWLAVLNQE
ncbi:hypothetical protein DKP78_14765 [Enterococcus faecium]|nr:hypothetical protein DKP78_14765 [Enterococcus faecium]